MLIGPAQAELPAKANQAWSRFTAANGGNWFAEWSDAGDRAVSLQGLTPPSAGKPEDIATAFLAANADVLGISGTSGELQQVSTYRDPGGTRVTFQQRYGGLPVFNGFVDVHVNQRGQVLLSQSRYAPGVARGAVSLQPALTPADAASAARAAHAGMRVTDKRGRPVPQASPEFSERPELGILIVDDVPHLAYRLAVGAVRYAVDARSGRVLEQVSLKHSATVTGRMFSPNPVYTLNNPALTDQNNTDYPALAGAYTSGSAVVNAPSDGTSRHRLIGPHVRTFNVPGTESCMAGETVVAAPPPVRADPNFLYNRSQTGFEHTMAYMHLDSSARHVRSLGFTSLFPDGIRVDAQAFAGDNAFYCASPTGAGYLAFGTGGVDDAEDADMLLHEYGHALQDAGSQGKYPPSGQPGAMAEGFGDYWAFAAQPEGSWAQCFGEWEGQGNCVRRLDRNKAYPLNYVGEVHADGEIWSRGLRDLFMNAGKTTANKIILGSHARIVANPTFSDGVKALIEADRAMFAGANKQHICSAFVDRGISHQDCGYWIRMTWNRLGADVDLHLRPPSGASDNSWDYAEDVAFYNANPNWGDPNSSSDDPRLYRDCTTDCVSEQITVSRLVPGTYRVMAHYYDSNSLGSAAVTVQVLQGTRVLFQGSRTLSNTSGSPAGGQIWFAYNIVVQGGNAQPQITVTDHVVQAATSRPGAVATKKQ